MDQVPARFWHCLWPALLSAGLLWACHFPLAWGWLGWIALVPFLTLIRSTARPWKVYIAAWLGAFAFFVAALQWMRHADWRMYFTWFLLAWYCSLYSVAGLALLRLFDRKTKLPLVIAIPVVWTALEFLRTWFLGGFGWYSLAYAQHDCLPLIQIADITGVWGVTFVVAAVNALVVEILFSWNQLAAKYSSLIWKASFVVLMLMVVFGYGFWRLTGSHFEQGPTIALIQGNIPQEVRNGSSNPNQEPRGDPRKQMMDHFDWLSCLAGQWRPDLIVWPETCYPEEWSAVEEGVPPDQVPFLNKGYMAEESVLDDLGVRRWQSDVLLGINFRVICADGKERRRNSNLLIRRWTQACVASQVGLSAPTYLSSGCGSPLAGAVQLVLAERTSKHSEFVVGHPAGRYDKMHLVPFGEYVPLYDVLPIMKYFAPYEYDYSVQPGTRQTHFSLGRYSFGAAICYEDTDPFLARRLVTPDASERPVDFIVNSSNDGWFKGSSEHEEHLAIARFRAVESRRPVIRAVNLGVSAVIDSNGSVLPPDTVAESNEPGKAPQGLETVPIWAVETPSGWTASLPPSRWQEFKAKPGVLLARLPIDHRESLYSIYGDWLALLCWGGLLVGVIEAFSGRRRPEVTT